LISEDRRTLPSAIADRLRRGSHTSGVLFILPQVPIGAVIEELVLIWHTSTQDEFVDSTQFIPL
jgi:hypothetical protein